MGRTSVNERLQGQNTSLLIWLMACLRRLPEHQCRLHKDELVRYANEFNRQNEGEYVNVLEEGDWLVMHLMDVPKILTPDGKPAFQTPPEAPKPPEQPVPTQCDNGMCGKCPACAADE